MCELGLIQHPGWYMPNIPDEAAELKTLEEIIGHVDFPPPESLSGRAGILVMIIVPSLSHGNDGQNRIVPTIVGCGIATGAEPM